MRERLFSELPEKVIRYLFEPAIENEMERSFQNMMDVNKAHLSMLMSEGIVSETAGHTIMQALIEIQAAGVEQLKIGHHLEDLYFNIEQGLIDRVGIEVAGQLSIGRSRDDFDAVVIRMNSRDGLQKVCKLVLKLRAILIERVDDYCDLDLNGYIHMQSLEPVTLGNYFSATLHALERDFTRIQKALQQSNVSPLGLGGMAGTAFSINRDKVARLLGFTDTMKNSLDGIASCDYILESLSAMNIFMSHINRLSYDLYMLSREEYGIVEFGDADTVTDGMMHKKKSLITAEHIKAKSSHVLAAVVSATHIPYGHYRGLAGESTKYFWGALNEVEAAVELLLEAMQTMEFKEPEMLERASDHFSIVTELTDLLVGEARISIRRAHQLIGHLINHIFQHQMSFKQLDAELIEQLSIQMFGKRISVPQEKIENALRSVTKVEAKKVQSGSVSREVKNQLERLKHKLLQDEIWMTQQVQKNHWSKDKLKNNLRQTP
ncbi:argininosuccinate lyase [Bacillus norwichensis]|uniref:Argininosuccinate lyase n=1 Tax=Bacillus norwichensis TaxID=2762217 RepID=A0ABR8VKS9_9BACI|nr:argininosuccinate lyase [Bacillus norwichensis]MBD8005370.1 argininosuccinate lyase [Bacillus norwichensis]